VTDNMPRLRALDAARGWALIFMILIHGFSLFLDPASPARDYAVLSVIFFLTKVTAPLFIWMFGMTMAYVYRDQLADPAKFERLKHRLLVRAGWVFLSREFLVLVVDLDEGRSAYFILKRLLFLQTGDWIEVLNFYTILLLLGPWVLRAWRRAPLLARLGAMAVMYGLGWALSHVPVPEFAVGIKNILVGYPVGAIVGEPPDTFPLFQLSVFFFAGLLAGEYLVAVMRVRAFTRLLAGGLALALLAFGMSLLMAGTSISHYVTAIAYDRYKYPPNLAYIFYGLALTLAVNVFCIWLQVVRGIDNGVLRMVELLGRNSLFTFNVHYFLMFTVCGMELGQLKHYSLLGSSLPVALILLVCLVGARLWEGVRRG
jgi:uncharacterized membrane protein